MARQKVKFAEAEFVVSPLTYWLIILAALLIAAAITTTLAFYTVQEGEVAVVSRLGKFYKLSEPGLHWRLPWGIDQVQRLKMAYPYRLELGFTASQSDSGQAIRQPVPEESRQITADLYLVDVFWTLTYRISDPKAYVFSTKEPTAVLRSLALAAMRTAVGNFTLQEIFQTRRAQAATLVQEKLQSELSKLALGIEIQSVELKEVMPVLKPAAVEVAPIPPSPAAPASIPDKPGTDSLQGGW